MQAYPRVIAAALPALIRCVAEDGEGALKAEKVRSLPLGPQHATLPAGTDWFRLCKAETHAMAHFISACNFECF